MIPLTKEQAIVVSAYTGYLICDFSDMHKEIENKLGYPVMTHQLASDTFYEKIREAFKEDFVAMLPTEYKDTLT